MASRWPNDSVEGQAMMLHELVDSASQGELANVLDFLAQGVDPDGHDPYYGFNALIAASRAGELEVVEALLMAGANVNARSDTGFTPLMSAAFRGFNAIVRKLLAAGAEVNAESSVGGTALEGTLLGIAHDPHNAARVHAACGLLEAGARFNQASLSNHGLLNPNISIVLLAAAAWGKRRFVIALREHLLHGMQ